MWVQDNALGGRELDAMVRTVYPEVTPEELRHFSVVVDTDGTGRLTFKKLQMAMKESKEVGSYVEGGISAVGLLSQLAVRMQDAGNNFRKVRTIPLGTIETGALMNSARAL